MGSIRLNGTQKARLKELTLNQHEWQLIESLRDTLKPFYDTTTALSGQTYPTMAPCFYIHRLLSHCLSPKTSDHPLVGGLKESLRYWFNIYCKAKLPQDSSKLWW